MLANSAEERKREKKRFPCRRAVEFNCPKTFASRGGAKVHVNKFHNSHRPYSCPMAVRFRRSKAFSSPELAKKHMESKHGGKTFPCPTAKQLVCPRLFTTRHEARLHVKKFTNQIRQRTQNCHPKRPPQDLQPKIDGHLRKCTVPACSHAISGMRMSEQDMDKHMIHHEYAGHLESRTPYPIPAAADDLDPEEVEELLTAMDKALEKERNN